MKSLFYYTAGVFCFVLFSAQIQAQPGGESKWSAGIVFSPDYAFRTLSYPDSGAVWKEHLNENDFPKLGYTTGISILYRLNAGFELESGLLYSSKGHRYKSPFLDQWHETDPAVPLEATTTYSFRYLDVPLKLNWFFLQKKTRLFLSAGLSAGIFIDEFTVQESVFPDRTETNWFNEEDVDFNAVTFFLSGGVGMEYSLSNHNSVRISPEFRHGFIPVADTWGKRYNWSVGLNTGLYFRLRQKGNTILAERNYRKWK